MPPTTLAEAHTKTETYITKNEALKAVVNNFKADEDPAQPKQKKERTENKREFVSWKEPYPMRDSYKKEKPFTPLNTDRRKILKIMNDRDLFQPYFETRKNI